MKKKNRIEKNKLDDEVHRLHVKYVIKSKY